MDLQGFKILGYLDVALLCVSGTLPLSARNLPTLDATHLLVCAPQAYFDLGSRSSVDIQLRPRIRVHTLFDRRTDPRLLGVQPSFRWEAYQLEGAT